MANSEVISKLKKSVIKEILSDSDLIKAIDPPSNIDSTKPKNLMYSCIFPYHQNPETLRTQSTFLTIEVQIPRAYDKNAKWINVDLEIYIISHQGHMRVDNIPKITDNRNDYLSKLIDVKFNGKSIFGDSKNDEFNYHTYGELILNYNIGGAIGNDYLYRKMGFSMTDVNNSFCSEN